MPKMKNEQYLVVGALGLSLIFALAGPMFGVLPSILLAIVGIVVGFTTISKSESKEFMIVSLVLGGLSVAAWAWLPAGTEAFGTLVKSFFANMSLVVVPAAVIVSVTRWYKLAGSKN